MRALIMYVHIKSAQSDVFGIFIDGNYDFAIVNKTMQYEYEPSDGCVPLMGLNTFCRYVTF